MNQSDLNKLSHIVSHVNVFGKSVSDVKQAKSEFSAKAESLKADPVKTANSRYGLLRMSEICGDKRGLKSYERNYYEKRE